MVFSIVLPPGRGTGLYRNTGTAQKLELKGKEPSLKPESSRILVIKGGSIGQLAEFKKIKKAKKLKEDLTLEIGENEEYMVINLDSNDLICEFSQDPKGHEVIYDPYLFEKEKPPVLNTDEFRKDFRNKFGEALIPDGYIDTLAKWYSIKFTYDKYNLIFLRPGVGISFQTHKLREEFWEVIYGSPVIVSGNNVLFNTKKGDISAHESGPTGLHTLINPDKSQWIAIKETYNGTFDESDIARIFNPNQYNQ